MNTLTTSSVVRQAGDVFSANIDAELVMMRLESNGYFGLDAIGRGIWELLAEPRSVSAICAALVAEYDVAPAACAADVLHFLNELVAYGVVAVENPHAAVA